MRAHDQGRQGRLMVVDPVILASARSTRSPTTTCSTPTATRSEYSTSTKAMLIGPDTAARFLEIGVSEAEGIEFIVHAMSARPRFLET